MGPCAWASLPAVLGPCALGGERSGPSGATIVFDSDTRARLRVRVQYSHSRNPLSSHAMLGLDGLNKALPTAAAMC